MDESDPMEILPVILCGGAGTRLWPRSRSDFPKPFLRLVGEQTLFRQAVDRCRGDGFADPVIVTGAAHVRLVEEQLGGVAVAEVIVEPERKNTAAAVALAAARARPEQVLLVCPSDHHIGDLGCFADAARSAGSAASSGRIVCMGVPAVSPDTRFGYIQLGERLGSDLFAVEQFTEKPALEAAEAFVASNKFVWNAGIFALRADRYLEELRRYRPRLAEAVEKAVTQGRSQAKQFYPDATAFSAVAPESIDCAVMENTAHAAVVRLTCSWSDVGDWAAVHRARDKDESGNSVSGPAEIVDCRNVLIDSDGPKVRAVGLDHVLIVVDGGDILVTKVKRD